MTTSNYLPAINGESGFLSYLRQIRSIPSLEEEEEYMLAKRYKEHDDASAAQKLVTSHLKLVAKIASGFKNYGLPMIELVSEGNIGLIQAVKKFEPDKGFRLSTYAMWWIKVSIQEYIIKSWSLVKIGTTAAQKKLFFNLGRVKRNIQNTEGRNSSYQDYQKVADELDVSIEDVVEMNLRMSQDTYIDDPIYTENVDSPTLLELLPSQNINHEYKLAELQEHNLKMSMFSKAFKNLNEREKTIINERKLKENPSTLEELSKKLGISRERVRQLEERAYDKLKSQILLEYRGDNV